MAPGHVPKPGRALRARAPEAGRHPRLRPDRARRPLAASLHRRRLLHRGVAGGGGSRRGPLPGTQHAGGPADPRGGERPRPRPRLCERRGDPSGPGDRSSHRSGGAPGPRRERRPGRPPGDRRERRARSRRGAGGRLAGEVGRPGRGGVRTERHAGSGGRPRRRSGARLRPARHPGGGPLRVPGPGGRSLAARHPAHAEGPRRLGPARRRAQPAPRGRGGRPLHRPGRGLRPDGAQPGQAAGDQAGIRARARALLLGRAGDGEVWSARRAARRAAGGGSRGRRAQPPARIRGHRLRQLGGGGGPAPRPRLGDRELHQRELGGRDPRLFPRHRNEAPSGS